MVVSNAPGTSVLQVSTVSCWPKVASQPRKISSTTRRVEGDRRADAESEQPENPKAEGVPGVGAGGSGTIPVDGFSGLRVCRISVYTSHRGDGVALAPNDAEGDLVRPAVLVPVPVQVPVTVAVELAVEVAVDDQEPVLVAVPEAVAVVEAVWLRVEPPVRDAVPLGEKVGSTSVYSHRTTTAPVPSRGGGATSEVALPWM